MGWEERIIIDSKIMGGKPVIKGTRLPVQIILGSLAGGMKIDDICKEYRITESDVRAALLYATEILTEEKVYAIPR